MIFARRVNDVEELRKFLEKSFPTEDLSQGKHCKRCSLSKEWDRRVSEISQTATIDDLFYRFGTIASLSLLPACSSTPLRAKGPEGERFEERYREVVEGLVLIADMSRQDMLNAAREIARHAHDPTARHWEAVKKILSLLLEGHKIASLGSTNAEMLLTN